MTWHSHTVVFCLWFAQPILQSVVAVIFWRRKMRQQFPAFFLFLLAQVVNFAVLFPLWLTGSSYYWPFWLGEAVNAVLGFKVIHEVFLDVFRPYHTLKDLGTLVFKWAGAVMLLVSTVVAFSSFSGQPGQNPVERAVYALVISVRVVQLGLIIFLLLFSRYLGVSRKQIGFGISLGFGFFAGVELMLTALRMRGFVTQGYFNLVNMTTYNLAIFVWLGYSLSRQSLRKPAVNRFQTQRWEQGLADLQHPVASDSLIPMFEGMVERAFSRSSNLGSQEETIPLDGPVARPRTNSAAAGSKTRP